MSQDNQPESIDITKLSIKQLDEFKNQIVQEVNLLQDSLSSLKMVQNSFVSSQQSLEQLKPIEEKQELLVPLTSSLYVPGRLVSNDKVIVDIGTGYYVQKSVDNAKIYFEKKIKFLTTQMEKLQPVLQQKMMIQDDVIEVLQHKIQLQNAAQKMAATQQAAQ
jgi:prefoldin alpha subunit